MKKTLRKINTVLVGFGAMISATLTRTVFAFADATNPADWLEQGDPSGGSLKPVVDQARMLGQNAYILMRTIGIALMVVCGIMAGAKLVISGKGQKKEETKDWILSICIGGVIIGAVVTIAGILLQVGGKLGN